MYIYGPLFERVDSTNKAKRMQTKINRQQPDGQKTPQGETKEFTGVFIPANVYLTRDISPIQKLLLSEIIALSPSGHGCRAGNAHFGGHLGCGNASVSEHIAALEKAGYVTLAYEAQKPRTIYPTPKAYGYLPAVDAVEILTNGACTWGSEIPKGGSEIPNHKYNINILTSKEVSNRNGESKISEKRAQRITEMLASEKMNDKLFAFWQKASNAWESWIEYKRKERKFSYKSADTELNALIQGVADCGGVLPVFMESVKRSSASGYQGLVVSSQKKGSAGDAPSQSPLPEKPKAQKRQVVEPIRAVNIPSTQNQTFAEYCEANKAGINLQFIRTDWKGFEGVDLKPFAAAALEMVRQQANQESGTQGKKRVEELKHPDILKPGEKPFLSEDTRAMLLSACRKLFFAAEMEKRGVTVHRKKAGA